MDNFIAAYETALTLGARATKFTDTYFVIVFPDQASAVMFYELVEDMDNIRIAVMGNSVTVSRS